MFSALKYISFPRNNRFLLLASLIFLAFFTGCKTKNADKTIYTPGFQKIYEKVNEISDSDPDSGVKYLDSAYQKLKSPNVDDNFRRLSFHFLIAGKIHRNFKKALVYADSMLTCINDNGGQKQYPSDFAEANFAKGDAFFELHDYNNAYNFYFTGYHVGKSYLNNFVISAYSYRMGMITYQQSHYNLSAKYFKDSYAQSLALDTDFVTFFRNQEVLDNIALAYKHLAKPDSALKYFDETITYLNKRSPAFATKANLIKTAIAVAYGNKADIFIAQKQYPTAINLLQQSIATNIKKGGDNADAVLSEIKLAKIYAAQKDNINLSRLLARIKGQFKTITSKNAESDWYSLMSDYYLSKNQPVLALNYNKRYNELKDSLSESTRLLKETNVNEQLNNYENEFQIKSLTKYNKLQRIYLLVSAAAGIMALVIIFLIFRNWRRSRKEVVTVNLLNDEVTRQKANLEDTLARLNQSSREKDRILHTVAHDLRNPLGGIASLSNILATEDGMDDEQKEYINMIKDTADNSLELINEILEVTDSGVTEPVMQPVDINALLYNSVELLKFKAAEKNQHIELHQLEKTEFLIINREKIWRVVSNLIVNAIKFSPVGGTILVSVVRGEYSVSISVKDEGIGIPENMQPHVFNMFTEAKRLGTMGEKSFGLGLSICYQIVEKHKGSIWFDSQEGKGTVFHVNLNRNNKALHI